MTPTPEGARGAVSKDNSGTGTVLKHLGERNVIPDRSAGSTVASVSI